MKTIKLTPFEDLTRQQCLAVAELWWKQNDTVEISNRLKISEADVCRVLARQQRKRRGIILSARRA